MSEPEELVSALPAPDEREVEASLRPKALGEFVGQPKVREQLQLVLESALRRNRPPDHVLLSGPPGLGKTSLAMIIAAELGTPIRVTSGPAIERAGDLAALLTSLTEGEVLFIDADEIALLRVDPEVGEVSVHFPRLGYDWRRMDKA